MRVIAGRARRLNLKTVPGLTTRPTTDRIKETLFNILQPDIPGCTFLDLFAGSGGIGIEALSRGASACVFVDNDPKACAVIRENLAFTRLADDAEVLGLEASRAITSLEGHKPFTFIFMDPPYHKGLEPKVLELLPELEKAEQDGGVANLYRLPGAQGNIGLISPINAHFCGSCNRIRLTSDGKLKPCLHSSVEYPIKGLDKAGMLEQFKTAIW